MIESILARPILEIAELAGIFLIILAVAVFLVIRIIKALHIRKIGVAGIECGEVPKRRLLRRKGGKSCAR